MVSIAVEGLDEDQSYKLISAAVTPRPIAWTATLAAGGLVNIAPFSSFTFISYSPPKVLISIGPGTDVLKDTLVNVAERGEFTISAVTPEFIRPMVESSHTYGPGVSEVAELGIDMMPSQEIDTPFVAGAQVAMECVLDRIIEVADHHAHRLVIGNVVRFHIADELWRGDRIDPVAYTSLGRIGGPLYVTRGEIVRAQISRSLLNNTSPEEPN